MRRRRIRVPAHRRSPGPPGPAGRHWPGISQDYPREMTTSLPWITLVRVVTVSVSHVRVQHLRFNQMQPAVQNAAGISENSARAGGWLSLGTDVTIAAAISTARCRRRRLAAPTIFEWQWRRKTTGALATQHLLIVLRQHHLQLPAIFGMYGPVDCAMIRLRRSLVRRGAQHHGDPVPAWVPGALRPSVAAVIAGTMTVTVQAVTEPRCLSRCRQTRNPNLFASPLPRRASRSVLPHIRR